MHDTALLHVADRLHAATAEGTPLGPALESVTDSLGGGHALLWTQARGQEGSIATARLDERDLHYLTASLAFDAPISPGKLPRGGPITRSALIRDRDFMRSGLYNECIRPLGGFHALFAKERRDGQEIALAVCRSPERGDFTRTETKTLRLLLPVLGTALELQQRLWVSERRNAALTSVLDRLPTGVVLTNNEARPVFVNARAAAIAAEDDGLGLDDRGVFGATALVTQAIKDAIAKVAEDGIAAVRRLRLERPSLRPPLIVTVLPVARLNLAIPGAPTPHCALFISESGTATIDIAALSDVFGLTRRESEVASLLAAGLDLKGIADRLGLGLATVRSHLMRVFEKTGTHSQATLVAFIRGNWT
jgi:DNA-binding CsgD family transcriptional regulator/PAS domain-containing protein